MLLVRLLSTCTGIIGLSLQRYECAIHPNMPVTPRTRGNTIFQLNQANMTPPLSRRQYGEKNSEPRHTQVRPRRMLTRDPTNTKAPIQSNRPRREAMLPRSWCWCGIRNTTKTKHTPQNGMLIQKFQR